MAEFAILSTCHSILLKALVDYRLLSYNRRSLSTHQNHMSCDMTRSSSSAASYYWSTSAGPCQGILEKASRPYSMCSVSAVSLKLHTDAHMHSISLVNDLSLIPSLGLFTSLCFFAGDAQIIIYGFWLSAQVVVGWGLVALLLQTPKKKMILSEMWSVFPVSFH